MTDPKIRRRALEKLRERREQSENEISRRRALIYRRIPRVGEIDRALRSTMAELAAAALKSGADPAAAVNTVRQKNLDLQQERAELLVSAGYPIDYLDPHPACPLCGDTGRVGSRVCSCFEKLCLEEQRLELSSMLDLSGQSFDTFDFNWYSDEPNPLTDVSPRENIATAYDICLEYARKFGADTPGIRRNLFLNGGTGLGKTFLSSCIAGEVAAAGWSVVYDTAISIMDVYEAVRFSRGEAEKAEAARRRITDCDLLIIDDLGTEMTTAFLLSSLYSLINTRLIERRHTVINSNLTMEDIRRRYTPQIVSRLEGEYTTVYFFGEDIRVKKNRA